MSFSVAADPDCLSSQPYSEKAWVASLGRVTTAHVTLRRCGLEDLERMEREAATLLQLLQAKLDERQRQAGNSPEALEEEISGLLLQEDTMRAETLAAAKTLKQLKRGFKLRWTSFLNTRSEMAQNVSHNFGMYVEAWVVAVAVDTASLQDHGPAWLGWRGGRGL